MISGRHARLEKSNGHFCGRLVSVSDEADNLVLRLLREMRADMATKDDLGALRAEMKADISDLRQDVSEGFSRTTAALTTLARRLDDVDHGIRLADRLTAIEKRLADLEVRRGPNLGKWP